MSKKRLFGTAQGLDLLSVKSEEIEGPDNRGLKKSGLNGKINSQVLYDYENKTNRTPYHELELGSGTMWICNSKRVSHQAVKGNRLLVFSRYYPALSLTQSYLPT